MHRLPRCPSRPRWRGAPFNARFIRWIKRAASCPALFHSSARDAGSSGLLGDLYPVDRECPALRTHAHCVAVANLAFEDQGRERVLQVALNDALQGARTIDGIVAGIGEPRARVLVELERYLPVGQELFDALQLDVDDCTHLLPCKPAENQDLV